MQAAQNYELPALLKGGKWLEFALHRETATLFAIFSAADEIEYIADENPPSSFQEFEVARQDDIFGFEFLDVLGVEDLEFGVGLICECPLKKQPLVLSVLAPHVSWLFLLQLLFVL